MKLSKELSLLLLIHVVLLFMPILFNNNIAFINILIICLIYGIVTGAWDLLIGFSGVFSFGAIAFFVVGAYASAVSTNYFILSPWYGMVIGGCFTAIIAIIISLACLRIKGAYVALLTFAFHLLLEQVLRSELGIRIGTGGAQGITKIIPISILGYEFSKLNVILPFYTTLILSFVIYCSIYFVINSKTGIAFNAIRDNEELAISLGISEIKFKIIVFAMSGFITGLIGGYYAHYVGVLSTRLLGLDMFLLVLISLIVGGSGIFPGSIIGTFIIYMISEYLNIAGVYRLVIFGVLVIIFCRFLPDGLMGLIYRCINRYSLNYKKHNSIGKPLEAQK